jgi:hypothetical protein
MIKANDLIIIQKKRDEKKYITYNKIYHNIEKKIKLASDTNNYYTWYQIPEFLIGLPFYDLLDCKKYIIETLNENGFKILNYDNNLILISWFP